MYFITFIASPKKPKKACGTFLCRKYYDCPSYYFIYWSATDQSVRIHDLPYVEVRMLAQIFIHCKSVPARTVVGVVPVVEEQLLPQLDVPVGKRAGDDAVPGVVTEPLPAVVVKVVVHLVAEGGRIVVDLYEIARQIDPLSAGVVSIDEYLVSGTLPVLLLSWFVGKSYLQ